MNIFLARQPVFDRDLNVVGYELLYRASEDAKTAGVIDDPDKASSQVLINAFVDMGIDQIVGDVPALVNVTRSFIESNQLPANLADKVILEILETETIDEQFVEVVKSLSSKGYRYALDDFEFDQNWALLIPGASIIKYDVMALGLDGTAKQLRILNKFKQVLGGIDAKLLAEKVETHEEFEHYKALGFDYFQGYFMSKPKVLKEKGVPASKMVVLSLLGELNNPEANVEQLEKLISSDARLTYKLLKVVNSASFVTSSKVDTIQQAIVILGLDELRCWASLLALSLNDGKPQELLATAMVRARMCQSMAEKMSVDDTNIFFTAGLFSLMDALMDVPLEEILHSMPFSQELVDGLIPHEGTIGEVLKTVIAYEEGEWEETKQLEGITQDDLWECYTGAVEWAQVASNRMSQ